MPAEATRSWLPCRKAVGVEKKQGQKPLAATSLDMGGKPDRLTAALCREDVGANEIGAFPESLLFCLFGHRVILCCPSWP